LPSAENFLIVASLRLAWFYEGVDIEATLIFPGLSAQQVVGIDVLHGFQQQQVTSEEDGNLVLRNLLVKDYPVFLCLTP
jgi:hypothetical protein